MFEKLMSRKLWVALLSLGAQYALPALGVPVPPETVYAAAGVAATYLLGQSAVDWKQYSEREVVLGFPADDYTAKSLRDATPHEKAWATRRKKAAEAAKSAAGEDHAGA